MRPRSCDRAIPANAAPVSAAASRTKCARVAVISVHGTAAVGDFYRAFTIADGIDPDRIAAEMKNGVLTVHLPKAEKVKPKRIAVHGG